MIYLVLGANLGDREWNLERSKALLSEALKCDMKCSEILETEAIGFDGQPFLNQIVAFESGIEPEMLLDLCQSIEQQIGRPAHEVEYDTEGKRVYKDRLIDIDILMYNDVNIDSPRLRVPHPQLYERPFVEKLLNTFKI